MNSTLTHSYHARHIKAGLSCVFCTMMTFPWRNRPEHPSRPDMILARCRASSKGLICRLIKSSPFRSRFVQTLCFLLICNRTCPIPKSLASSVDDMWNLRDAFTCKLPSLANPLNETIKDLPTLRWTPSVKSLQGRQLQNMVSRSSAGITPTHRFNQTQV